MQVFWIDSRLLYFEDIDMTISNVSSLDDINKFSQGLEKAGIDPSELIRMFDAVMSQEGEKKNASPAASAPAQGSASPAASVSAAAAPSATPVAAADKAAGTGENSVSISNTSNHDEKIGEFLNGGSTTAPVAEITLKPGETGKLSYANGQGGFMAEADSSGAYKPSASRLEFYADAKGINNTDVSYIDGRNAAIQVSDGKGKSAGDTQNIASQAPSDIVSHDSGGNATVTGWYDGSSAAMQAGGSFMEQKLGTGNAYIHPDDDQKRTQSANPMTMAQDSSQNYTASFGDA